MRGLQIVFMVSLLCRRLLRFIPRSRFNLLTYFELKKLIEWDWNQRIAVVVSKLKVDNGRIGVVLPRSDRPSCDNQIPDISHDSTALL